MSLSISELKQHAEAFVASEINNLSIDYHAIVHRFTDYVEGKRAKALADARALLEGEGFTVVPPAPPTAA